MFLLKNQIFAIVIGIAFGLGVVTFGYAKGFSYFSHDPQACINCHIMNDEYNAWQKGSHHAAAVCVDCHMPEGLAAKVVAKADNGFRHSKGFTLQDFHEPIQITRRNSEILQENCLRCHGELTHKIVLNDDLYPAPKTTKGARTELNCVHCHSHVGHGQ